MIDREGPIPTSLGKFRIQHELGRGAMGVVYLGLDPFLDRLAAVKVFKAPPGAGDRTVRGHRERFFIEARAAGRLDHPSVVKVFDVGEDEATGATWIAMEFVEADDLAQLIDEGLSPKRLSSIVTHLAGALDHAHSRGIIHRDVKPTNVLIDPSGVPRLSDFGVARLAGLSVTAPGVVLGSPAYMAPEQIPWRSGGCVDGRSRSRRARLRGPDGAMPVRRHDGDRPRGSHHVLGS